MTLSIVHRATGIALYAGMLVLLLWLLSVAFGDGTLNLIHAIFGHWLGQIVLFGFTWALFHHLCGGLRYFIWDTANGMGHPEREYLALFNLIAPIILTLGAWLLVVWL